MGMKQTYSIPGHLGFNDENIDNDAGKKIAESCELAYIILNSEVTSGATVDVHDCEDVASANYNNRKMVLDTSNTGNDTRIFPNPVAFEKGVVVILRQGANFDINLDFGTVTPR